MSLLSNVHPLRTNGALVPGAGEPEPFDWSTTEVDVYSDAVASRRGTNFKAAYEFEFMRVDMHGWVKLGVLVIAVFTRFTDNSGRLSYFDREFFHALEPAE